MTSLPDSDHSTVEVPCAYCHGDGEACNPGNTDPKRAVLDWLAPVICPRCGGTGKDPNHGEDDGDGTCGRLLVGQGDDTYDPLCVLPAGHAGSVCKPRPTVISGPPREDLPYRWGCPCGATWNSDSPEQPSGALCGPTTCGPLFSLASDDQPLTTTEDDR